MVEGEGQAADSNHRYGAACDRVALARGTASEGCQGECEKELVHLQPPLGSHIPVAIYWYSSARVSSSMLLAATAELLRERDGSLYLPAGLMWDSRTAMASISAFPSGVAVMYVSSSF